MCIRDREESESCPPSLQVQNQPRENTLPSLSHQKEDRQRTGQEKDIITEDTRFDNQSQLQRQENINSGGLLRQQKPIGSSHAPHPPLRTRSFA